MANPDLKATTKVAVALVAATTAFLMGMTVWVTFIMSSPDWCDRAVDSATEAKNPRSADAVQGCFALLSRQVESLSLNSHIMIGIIALCLGVLVVIILAQGRLSLGVGGGKMNVDVGAAEAADEVVEAAAQKADEFKG